MKALIGPRVEAEIIREARGLLEEKGFEITQTWLECADRDDEVQELLRDKDAYLPGAELITAQAIDEAKRLRVIARFGVGVDNIDLEAATRNGIVVTNAAGANRDAVAELVVGLMIGIARSIPWSDRQMRDANWVIPVGKPVAETTLGLIGLGAIGKEVVQRLQGFDMKVLAYDVVRDEDFASQFDIQYAELDEVLKNADFISLHVPLLESTRGIIGREELQAMKSTAYLINAARGGVVDESALHQALVEGWIAGAAADVFEHEPPEGSPLLELNNFIATPHMGVFTDRTLARVALINARAIVDVLEGRRPPNVVNPQVYETGLKPPPAD
jgi:D-3-phosphoglycerate dehydrogenase